MTSREFEAPRLLSNRIGGVAFPPHPGDLPDDLDPATGALTARRPRPGPAARGPLAAPSFSHSPHLFCVTIRLAPAQNRALLT